MLFGFLTHEPNISKEVDTEKKIQYPKSQIWAYWLTRPILCIPLVIICLGILFRYARHAMAIEKKVDFLVYREGANIVIHGGHLYELMPILGPGHMWLPFLYPPIAGVFLSPFIFLSTDRGQQLITVINIFLPIIILAIVFPRLKIYQKIRTILFHYVYGPVALMGIWVLFSTMTLYLWPIMANQVWGQVNIILEFLIVIDLFILNKTPRYQGILTGIAGAIKVTPLGIIVYYIIRKQWSTVANIALSFVLLTGSGFLLSYRNSIKFWSSVTFHPEKYIGIRFGANIGIHGIYTRLIVSEIPLKAVWLITCLSIGLCGLYLIYQLVHMGEFTLAALITIFVTLLISPISWTYHWTWIGVLLLVTADFSYRYKSKILFAWTIVTYLFFSSRIELCFPSGRNRELRWHWYQHLSIGQYSFLILVLFAILGHIIHFTAHTTNRTEKLHLSMTNS